MPANSLKIIILFLFINYSLGCSVMHLRQLKEVRPKEYIRAAITPSGKKIGFDHKNGYHYTLGDSAIVGISKSGYWVILRMKYVKEIRKTSPKMVRSSKDLRNQEIIELVTKNNTVVQFNDAGGIYDDSDNTIKGLNLDGNEESYKLKSIMGARVEPPCIVSKDSLMEMKDPFIKEVVTSEQKLVILDRRGGMFVEPSNVLVGYNTKGDLVRLNRDQIDTVYAELPFLSANFRDFIIGGTLGAMIFYILAYDLFFPSD